MRKKSFDRSMLLQAVLTMAVCSEWQWPANNSSVECMDSDSVYSSIIHLLSPVWFVPFGTAH